MGQSPRSRQRGAVDKVITNADDLALGGNREGEIGIKDARIAAIAKAADNPSAANVDIIIGRERSVIAGEG